MKDIRSFLAVLLAMTMAAPLPIYAASHREAPITALDHPADITDFYAFVSYDDPTKVTFILDVDPFLEPSNGPNYFPFDPDVVYRINIDNTFDAVEDITFEFRFTTNIRAPQVFTGFVGAGGGLSAPGNAPNSAPTPANGSVPAQAGGSTVGTPVIPPAITALDGAGAAGFSLQQTYTVTMITNKATTTTGDDGTDTPSVTSNRVDLTGGKKLIAVPSYVGPRTMPCYKRMPNGNFPPNGGFNCSGIQPLAEQGIYSLNNGVRVFAGTVDDPFYIDLGAAFDSLNIRSGAFFNGGSSPLNIPTPILEPTQDQNDTVNFAADSVSGFNVNAIAIEVPIAMIKAANPASPTIGTWGSTLRAKMQVRPTDPNATAPGPNDFTQIQRMGNPLINELIIGTGSKDKWSMSQPKDDAQFAASALDPLLPRVLNAVFGLTVPDPPRTDLLPLVVYAAPLVGPNTPTGPVADLLRLNYSIGPTAAGSRKRLGFIAGDSAGFPNGRRVSDDVTDIALRAVAGILCSKCTAQGQPFSASSVPPLGDGVNSNDLPYQETFPYVAFAHSGRGRRHIDPGERGCSGNNQVCPEQ